MPTPRDFRPLLKSIASDIDTYLTNHPDSIKALLFRADRSNKEQLTDLEDNVGSMEASDKIFEFADPVPVFAMELPVEFPTPMDTADEFGSGFQEEPVAMLISGGNIPKGSVLLYDYYDDPDSDHVSRTILYIERIQSLSKQPGSASVYFMMPFMDFDERFVNAE